MDTTKVAQLKDITKCDDVTARQLLTEAGGDLSLAANRFFTSGTGGAPATMHMPPPRSSPMSAATPPSPYPSSAAARPPGGYSWSAQSPGPSAAGARAGLGAMAGMNRDASIRWAVARLTADEARGKVALLTEELKQMKLMETEIRLVKDALRKQQKELATLEEDGARLDEEVQYEQSRRLTLARMLDKARKDYPLLDASKYPLTPEDLRDQPLLPLVGDAAAATTANPQAPSEGADASVTPEPEPEKQDPVVDDLLSLIMGNTAVGAELGVTATTAPAANPFLQQPAVLATAAAPKAAALEPEAASSVLLTPPKQASSTADMLSPFGPQISAGLFKPNGFTDTPAAPTPAPPPEMPASPFDILGQQ
jgi:hypothetical protein